MASLSVRNQRRHLGNVRCPPLVDGEDGARSQRPWPCMLGTRPAARGGGVGAAGSLSGSCWGCAEERRSHRDARRRGEARGSEGPLHWPQPLVSGRPTGLSTGRAGCSGVVRGALGPVSGWSWVEAQRPRTRAHRVLAVGKGSVLTHLRRVTRLLHQKWGGPQPARHVL